VVNLTVGAILALGANPKDPNLNRIHEIQVDPVGNTYQLQLVKGVIIPVPVCFRCPKSTLLFRIKGERVTQRAERPGPCL
jgi:hypothetical protein